MWEKITIIGIIDGVGIMESFYTVYYSILIIGCSKSMEGYMNKEWGSVLNYIC
jgi:hypothetical protein